MIRTELESPPYGWVKTPKKEGFYVGVVAPDRSLKIVQWPNKETERKVLLWLPLPKTYKTE